MNMMDPALIAQFVVAASVGYALRITFFQPKAVDKRRAAYSAAAKVIVKQRSERWAA
jgi:hypothetical protein